MPMGFAGSRTIFECTSAMRWRAPWRLAACVLAALALAGCVDREPQQRAAFIHWLDGRVAPMQGAVAPPMPDDTREAIGGYARHYAVIEAFQTEMTQALRVSGEATQLLSVHTVEDLLARRDRLLALRAELHRVQASVPKALVDARRARADLIQAPGLKTAYDAAFAAAVERPAQALPPLWPLIEPTLASALQAADFIALRQGEIASEGPLTQVRDPSVRDALNARLVELNLHSEALGQARTRWCALAPAECTP
ncbi:hypothetical protein CEG14_18115 [Bordetella genomosp. 1]|uniref:DUF3053 domain-containing protein n=1 Tax=Bordetella genomosp. 1 TaxID=1395607 RepID=A0A261S6K3_9BORD|nr:hypothetical protein CEG14_18115 [Bordetella genomosp. 1]